MMKVKVVIISVFMIMYVLNAATVFCAAFADCVSKVEKYSSERTFKHRPNYLNYNVYLVDAHGNRSVYSKNRIDITNISGVKNESIGSLRASSHRYLGSNTKVYGKDCLHLPTAKLKTIRVTASRSNKGYYDYMCIPVYIKTPKYYAYYGWGTDYGKNTCHSYADKCSQSVSVVPFLFKPIIDPNLKFSRSSNSLNVIKASTKDAVYRTIFSVNQILTGVRTSDKKRYFNNTLSLYMKRPVYKVIYNGNGGKTGDGLSSLMQSVAFADGSEVKNGTFENYTLSDGTECRFKNWNTRPDGSGKSYVPGTDISNMDLKDGETFSLYAVWEECKPVISTIKVTPLKAKKNGSVYTYGISLKRKGKIRKNGSVILKKIKKTFGVSVSKNFGQKIKLMKGARTIRTLTAENNGKAAIYKFTVKFKDYAKSTNSLLRIVSKAKAGKCKEAFAKVKFSVKDVPLELYVNGSGAKRIFIRRSVKSGKARPAKVTIKVSYAYPGTLRVLKSGENNPIYRKTFKSVKSSISKRIKIPKQKLGKTVKHTVVYELKGGKKKMKRFMIKDTRSMYYYPLAKKCMISSHALVNRSWDQYSPHMGVDMATGGKRVKILASNYGKVVKIFRNNAAFGNCIVLAHTDGIKTIYKHIANGTIRVRKGQRVNAGQVIAKTGNTGQSTGTHLHFEANISKNSTKWARSHDGIINPECLITRKHNGVRRKSVHKHQNRDFIYYIR